MMTSDVVLRVEIRIRNAGVLLGKTDRLEKGPGQEVTATYLPPAVLLMRGSHMGRKQRVAGHSQNSVRWGGSSHLGLPQDGQGAANKSNVCYQLLYLLSER